MDNACLRRSRTREEGITGALAAKLEPSSAMPLFMQVRAILSDAIRNGVLAPGSFLPSTAVLARQLRVSLMTAHRAVRCLAADGLVTRSRGQRTQVREDFRQALALAPRFRVCVAMRAEAEETDPSDLNALVALQAVAGAIAPPTERILHHYKSPDELQHIKAEGIICIQPNASEAAVMEKLARTRPVILLGERISAPGLYCVDADVEQGARAAVSHLVNMGHENIVMMFDSRRTAGCQAKIEGYKSEMLARSKSVHDRQVIDAPACERSLQRLLKRLMAHPRGAATAIVAADPRLAMRLHCVLVRSGIRIPEDMSLVGFQDNWIAERLNPPMTVVARPVREMARRAFSRLLVMLSGKSDGSQLALLPTSLIVRGTTAPVRSTGMPTIVQGRESLARATRNGTGPRYKPCP